MVDFPDTLADTADDFDGSPARILTDYEAMLLGLPPASGPRCWVETPGGHRRQYHHRHLLGGW